MRHLADYKNEDAIELWANILEPLMAILQDDEILDDLKNNRAIFQLARTTLKNRKKEAVEIVLAIDPTEITGLNLIPRIVEVFTEIRTSEEFAGFFGSAKPGTTAKESSGAAMASIGEGM